MRKINTLTDFLMAVKANELKPDFDGQMLSQFGPLMVTDDQINNYASVSIEFKLVSGIGLGSMGEDVPGLYVNSPVLTPNGEEYLRNQNLFKKYPVFEKTLLVVITGIVSALTTLLVQYLTN